MSFDITFFYPLLIACLLGVVIATGHLALLRFGVQRISVGSTSAARLVIMSLVCMMLVAGLLVAVSQQLDLIPLLLLGASYVVSRIILIPTLMPNNSTVNQ